MAENILIEESRSHIREGKLEEVKAVMNELVELVKAKEPRIIFYNAYINEDGTQLTILQAHPDSASVEFHIEVTEPAFTKIAKSSLCQASISIARQVRVCWISCNAPS